MLNLPVLTVINQVHISLVFYMSYVNNLAWLVYSKAGLKPVAAPLSLTNTCFDLECVVLLASYYVSMAGGQSRFTACFQLTINSRDQKRISCNKLASTALHTVEPLVLHTINFCFLYST